MRLDSQVSSDPSSTPSSNLDEEQAPEQTASDEAVVTVAPVWLQRLSLFVLVLFCVYLGVLVTILPWWSRIWDHNALIESRPALAALLHLGAVRGLISGLGLLDIWIGISEAIHYRDHRP
jgi:hypothetical protein